MSRRLAVECNLPYLLSIDEGPYPPLNEPLRFEVVGSKENEKTRLKAVLEVLTLLPDDSSERQTHFNKLAKCLLDRVNAVIRWYRVIADESEVVEVGLGDLALVSFRDLDTGLTPYPPLVFFPQLQRTSRDGATISREIKRQLTAACDPPVEKLVLLDAAHALRTGRFRESVLHSWAVIDSVFTRKYESLVRERLSGEYADGLKFVSGHEIPMRVRMTAMLSLLAGQSLFKQREIWDRLSTSYTKRNDVIHRALPATEKDAKEAMAVATAVIDFVSRF